MREELPWVAEARKHIGVREIKGPTHNGLIVSWWKRIKRGGIKDDETAWCAAFVGACLEAVGIQSTRFEGAGSYLTWGQHLYEPFYGCIVVFKRQSGGHVGFVVGETPDGHLLVLGGNQGDAVNIKVFPKDRVAGYRWPTGELGAPFSMPVLAGNYETSVRES